MQLTSDNSISYLVAIASYNILNMWLCVPFMLL